MKENQLPGGLWPVMLTPIKENNEIDYDGLQALTNFYIEKGANGLFANCQSSEMFQLTNGERLRIIHTVVETASKWGTPVVASGTFDRDMGKNSEFIKKVYDVGVEAVVVLTNQMAEVEDSEDILKGNIEELLKLTGDIPLGLYECPIPYKRLLSPALMNWLGGSKRFLYHKDTSCNPQEIKDKLRAIENTKLKLYNANTATALYSLEEGGNGISPIGANLYPELYTFLIREFKKVGRTEQLDVLNAQMSMMDTVVDQCYPFSAKYFLKKRGLPITTACRVPYTNAKMENYVKLEALMKVFRKMATELGLKIDKLEYA